MARQLHTELRLAPGSLLAATGALRAYPLASLELYLYSRPGGQRR